jgi:hypothetical protein
MDEDSGFERNSTLAGKLSKSTVSIKFSLGFMLG